MEALEGGDISEERIQTFQHHATLFARIAQNQITALQGHLEAPEKSPYRGNKAKWKKKPFLQRDWLEPFPEHPIQKHINEVRKLQEQVEAAVQRFSNLGGSSNRGGGPHDGGAPPPPPSSTPPPTTPPVAGAASTIALPFRIDSVKGLGMEGSSPLPETSFPFVPTFPGALPVDAFSEGALFRGGFETGLERPFLPENTARPLSLRPIR